MVRARGFTLIEMAVVVAVIALLLGSILIPLATQIEERRLGETRRILDEAREALLGFAVANGRLPCPASSTSNGVESIVSGACSHAHNGFVPAATLGLAPTDNEGFSVDPWGNRIRYSVTTAGTLAPIFTNPTSSASVSKAFLSGTLTTTEAPDLQVCSTGTGVSAATCATGKAVVTNALAVLFSVGPNGVSGTGGPDEIENGNGDRLFISRPMGAAGSGEGEFDDVVVWLSPHMFYNRLVVTGRLP